MGAFVYIVVIGQLICLKFAQFPWICVPPFRFEKRKAKREAERRLQIMRLESSVFSCEISIQNYKRKLMQEKAAAKAVAADIRLQLFAAQYTRYAFQLWLDILSNSIPDDRLRK